MSLCIFSQHKLLLNSFLNILLTATNLAKIVNLSLGKIRTEVRINLYKNLVVLKLNVLSV